jgi:tetratricopeptide (TPR) repeat protein
MIMMKRFQLIFMIAMIAVAGIAAADVVVMKDGRTLDGKITRETDDAITLKLKYGEVEIPKSRIAEIQRCLSALEEYEKKAASVEETPEAHYDLGQWCAGKGLREEAKEHFRKALGLDPSFAPAGRALGYEQVEGKWLSPDEAAEARGLVKFEGKWIAKEERDNILAERDEKVQEKLRGEYGVGQEFHISKRKNTVLVSDMPEERRKELLEAAEALYTAMEEKFGELFVKGRDWPLVVFAFAKREDYVKRAEADGITEAAGTFGYYSGKNRIAYLFESASPATVQMLLHEHTHQVYVERMMRHDARSHAWVFEGLAECYEAREIVDGKLGKPRPHSYNLAMARYALEKGKLYPMDRMLEVDQLDELFDSNYETDECHIAYGQAWAMVYYLMEGENGKNASKLVRFVKKDVNGEGTPEEFKALFGRDLAKFQSKLDDYIRMLK